MTGRIIVLVQAIFLIVAQLVTDALPAAAPTTLTLVEGRVSKPA